MQPLGRETNSGHLVNRTVFELLVASAGSATLSEKGQMSELLTIPEFLSHLKTWGGYPVPFTTMWMGDKPDFRVTDEARRLECINERLCAICGRPGGH